MAKLYLTLVDVDVLSFFFSLTGASRVIFFFFTPFPPPLTTKTERKMQKTRFNEILTLVSHEDTCFQNLFLVRRGLGEVEREEKAAFQKRRKDGWEEPGTSE